MAEFVVRIRITQSFHKFLEKKNIFFAHFLCEPNEPNEIKLFPH